MRALLIAALLLVMFSMVTAGWIVGWWAQRLARSGQDPSERELVRLFALLARDPYFGREYSRPKPRGKK